jgi:hypothetical protein
MKQSNFDSTGLKCIFLGLFENKNIIEMHPTGQCTILAEKKSFEWEFKIYSPFVRQKLVPVLLVVFIHTCQDPLKFPLCAWKKPRVLH